MNRTLINNVVKLCLCFWFRYVVVLNSYEAIKDAYISHGSAFMDRHAEDMTKTLQLEDSKTVS